jgi:hypothetical protein
MGAGAVDREHLGALLQQYQGHRPAVYLDLGRRELPFDQLVGPRWVPWV